MSGVITFSDVSPFEGSIKRREYFIIVLFQLFFNLRLLF